MSQKNAVIELLRFVYASCIIFFHVSRFDLHTAMDTIVTLGPWNVCLFRMGNLSVEFFFVVSGYLMASSVYRVISSGQKSDVSIGEETCSYLFRKVRSIYPYYALAFSYIAVVVLLIDRDISYILKCLPSLIFLQRTGISEESFVSLAWYVSSMLMAMAVIYPLLKKYPFPMLNRCAVRILKQKRHLILDSNYITRTADRKVFAFLIIHYSFRKSLA